MDIVAQQSIEELRALIRQYPFASIFRVLLAAKTVDQDDYEGILTSAALRVPSRITLNRFLHPAEEQEIELETVEESYTTETKQRESRPAFQEEDNEPPILESERTELSAAVKKIDDLIKKEMNQEPTELDEELNKMYVQVAYEASLELETKGKPEDRSKANFMTWLDKMDGMKLNTPDEDKSTNPIEKVKEIDVNSIPDIAKKSTTLHPALYTETLGFIFEQQEKFDKAIEVYTVLMNRNPQKSDYFADKIKAINEKTNS